MIERSVATAIVIASTAFASAAIAAEDAPRGGLSAAAERAEVEAATAWVDDNAARLVRPASLAGSGGADGVVHGHSRVAVAEAPVIIGKMAYDCNFAVAVFDGGGDPVGVITDPNKPIVIMRPGQTIPAGDFHVVELDANKALFFTIMAVEADSAEEHAAPHRDTALLQF